MIFYSFHYRLEWKKDGSVWHQPPVCSWAMYMEVWAGVCVPLWTRKLGIKASDQLSSGGGIGPPRPLTRTSLLQAHLLCGQGQSPHGSKWASGQCLEAGKDLLEEVLVEL